MRQELREMQPGVGLVAQYLAHMMLVQALRLYLAEGRGCGARRRARRTRRALDPAGLGREGGNVAVELRPEVQGGGRIVERSHHSGGKTVYDWRHYLAVLQRKPGALRNGAPFTDMPDGVEG